MMLACNFIPGGRQAGQVSLAESRKSKNEGESIEMNGKQRK